MATIYFPWQYAADPTSGRPVSLGKMFFGIPDLDPEIPANQIQARVKQEDGTILDVAQPVLLNAGGVPTYLGSPVILDIVEEEFSWKILNYLDAQVYYNENNTPFSWGTNQIEDGAITTDKIEDFAVTTPKIADDAIDRTKIFSDVAGFGMAQNTTAGVTLGQLDVLVDDDTLEINISNQLQVKNLSIQTGDIADNAVTLAKMADDSVDQAEIIAGAIHQGELDTGLADSTFSVSVANVSERTTVDVDSQVDAGGEYSFSFSTAISAINAQTARSAFWFCLGASESGTFALSNRISLCGLNSVTGGTRTASGNSTNRFVNASAPWNMGHGDIALFIFLRVNKEGKVTGTSVAAAPVWGYNGKTSVVPDRVVADRNKHGEKIGVRKYKNIIAPDSEIITPPWEGGDVSKWDLEKYSNPEMVEVEIGQDLKNKDMAEIPHPFLTLKEGDSVVLIDPCSPIVDSLRVLREKGNVKVGQLFQDGYLEITDDVNCTAPLGVTVKGAKWRLGNVV